MRTAHRKWILVSAIFVSLLFSPPLTRSAEDPSARLKAWGVRTADRWLRAAGEPYDSAQVLQSTYMVSMRDGTHLATDVYLPFLPGAYPAIVVRTPYGKDNLADLAAVVAFLGYACVCQDSRGRYSSEGDCRAFLDDGWGLDPTGTHWDGYDTVEWAAGQTWCNGKVGMFGVSALGIAANFAAGSFPPHLECAVVGVAAADMYHQAAHQGGGFRKSLVEGWLADIDAIPEVLDLVIAHEAYDPFWQNASVEARHASIDIPIYHSGGWYDIFLEGTLDFFAALQSSGADPAARGNQKVVIGPWTHSGQESYQQGELTYPANSVIADDETQRMLQWFDYWLKGEVNGITDLPPVRYYVMGDVGESTGPGNEWREGAGWPVSATPSALYLASDGRLLASPPGAGNQPDSFVYDPDNPVPTVGGANLKIPAGPYDQRSVESRSDVLVFTSSALTEPLEIVGPIGVLLYGSSTALDTDWVVRLCDVYPDVRSMLVTDGIRRARFRDSYETSDLLVPGEIYEFEIDLWPTATVFNTGHRIRIDISSSNDPRFDPNPNTGDPLRQNTETIIATNTVYHDADHPSHLILPVTAPSDHPLFRPAATHVGSYIFLD